MNERLAFQSALGLSITARCPISCAHCIVRAGRDRTEGMHQDFLRAVAGDYAAYGHDRARCVIITGGEPFFVPELLEFAVAHVAALGLVPIVVTNAFWAKSRDAARATLARLPGIGMLSVSTDRYHRRYLSLDHVKNAALAAREGSVAFTVAVCADSEAEKDELARELEDFVEADRIRVAATLPAGRAAEAAKTLGARAPLEEWEGPCTGADFPIVFPDGRLVACMGIVDGLSASHPLLLGNLHDKPLAALLASAEENVFLHTLRCLGPESILRELPGWCAVTVAERRQRGFGPCSLCYAMAEDERLLDCVLGHVCQPEVREKTAYARLHFLGEEHMAARIATGDEDKPAESDGPG